jgi:hypothetical protein
VKEASFLGKEAYSNQKNAVSGVQGTPINIKDYNMSAL